MSNDYFNPPNSVWPNGLKRDAEGYVTFYPTGTNKVDISTITWPEGDKLVSPFVYQNGELVGFVDTKALTVSGSATTTMNYNHIEADFASISEGKLTVNVPNATVKKFSWAVSSGSDETFDFVIIDFNTTDAETINTVRTAKRVVDNKLYDADDNLIGTWDTSKLEVAGIFNEEPAKLDGLFCNMEPDNEAGRGLILSEFDSDLSSLIVGSALFSYCDSFTSFNTDLPSLTNGEYMFAMCPNLTSFSSNLSNLMNGNCMFVMTGLTSFNVDLPSLTNGESMFGMSGLTTFTSEMPSLTSGISMFYNCTALTSFISDLSSLTNGERMFNSCKNLTSFNADLSSLTNGMEMFSYCSKLESFSSNLSNLTSGGRMFDGCTNLTSFSSDLRSLTDGISMFYDCENLTSFSSDLPSLTNSERMFDGCTNLESFSSNLPSLTNGYCMFHDCKNLISFSSDLSSLTNGDSMFFNCYNLKTFSADLSSLTVGNGMFFNCKLDTASVKNIIETINTYTGSLTLGLDCDHSETDKNLFAQEVGYADMTSLLAALQDKGWTVSAQYNANLVATYGLRRPSEDTLPVFVKLEEVEETDSKLKTFHTHTSMDGSKKYMLKWFHETTGSTEGYTQFASLEEAVAHFNIKPIERN